MELDNEPSLSTSFITLTYARIAGNNLLNRAVLIRYRVIRQRHR